MGWVVLFCGVLASAQQSSAPPPNAPTPSPSNPMETSSAAAVPAPDQTPTGTKELAGTVVKVIGHQVYLEHLGPVIPFSLDPRTKFESAGLTRAKEIKEGQKLRINFAVRNKIDNVALTVWLEGATSTHGFSGPLDQKQTSGRQGPTQ